MYSLCARWIHKRCAKLSLNDLRKLSNQDGWWCQNCVMLFPCHSLDNERLLLMNTNDSYISNFNYFDHYDVAQVESKSSDFDTNIDPDRNFFNDISKSCRYYSEDNFHPDFCNRNGFSIVHFNAKSINKNFSETVHFLNELKYTFDLIAISESWLDDSKIRDFNIEGYEVMHQF